MARETRPPWKKKTNWGIAALVVTAALAMFPPTTVIVAGVTVGALTKFIGAISGGIIAHGIADRAGKANE